ncbi:Spo0E family sporulation regulatory protein-aspartic acid phosphatase [Bacillus thuringiensis]|uniref:Spo0E family sporulation regulatory protein-aspartic acid phosphatase n=1 Tax=Bacillus thuringiensis TaxID=1428 RepID=UPI0018D0E5DF
MVYNTGGYSCLHLIFPIYKRKIKKKQKILRKLTKLYGFTHPVVVAYSQELDPLVVLVMRYLSS